HKRRNTLGSFRLMRANVVSLAVTLRMGRIARRSRATPWVSRPRGPGRQVAGVDFLPEVGYRWYVPERAPGRCCVPRRTEQPACPPPTTPGAPLRRSGRSTSPRRLARSRRAPGAQGRGGGAAQRVTAGRRRPLGAEI